MAAYKFFRYLWRTNAILILLAALAITVVLGSLVVSQLGWKSARDREADAGVQVVPPDAKEKLTLGPGEIVAGNPVLRASLFVNSEGKFSSGGSGSYSETRNIPFLEPAEKTAHWLLADNDHVVAETLDITDEGSADAKRTIATAFFVRPKGDEEQNPFGRLLLVGS